MAVDRTEYLLACLAEEAGEVVQAVGKCLRFGLNDKHPKTGNVPNFELLQQEFAELVAVGEMLGLVPSLVEKAAKKNRVLDWMEYADSVKKGA